MYYFFFQDEQEFCFVGDELVRELSKVDHKADELYLEAAKKRRMPEM